MNWLSRGPCLQPPLGQLPGPATRRDIYFLFSLRSSYPVGSPYPASTSNNDNAAKAQTPYSFAAVALRGTRKAFVEEGMQCLSLSLSLSLRRIPIKVAFSRRSLLDVSSVGGEEEREKWRETTSASKGRRASELPLGASSDNLQSRRQRERAGLRIKFSHHFPTSSSCRRRRRRRRTTKVATLRK